MEDAERRMGLNEAIFREANERIREVNETFATLTDELKLICECGHGTCAEQISMKPGDYRRSAPSLPDFAIVPGHEIPDVEEVIARGEEYAIVRKKKGIPRRVAEVSAPVKGRRWAVNRIGYSRSILLTTSPLRPQGYRSCAGRHGAIRALAPGTLCDA